MPYYSKSPTPHRPLPFLSYPLLAQLPMACCQKSLPTMSSPRLQSAHAYPQPCTLSSLLWPTHISLNAHHTTALFFLSSPALLKLYREGDACILPLSHKYPRTPACPRLMSWCLPQLPVPSPCILSHHSKLCVMLSQSTL